MRRCVTFWTRYDICVAGECVKCVWRASNVSDDLMTCMKCSYAHLWWGELLTPAGRRGLEGRKGKVRRWSKKGIPGRIRAVLSGNKFLKHFSTKFSSFSTERIRYFGKLIDRAFFTLGYVTDLRNHQFTFCNRNIWHWALYWLFLVENCDSSLSN